MNKIRTVETILAPPPPHMVGDGFRVHSFFPQQGGPVDKYRMSPFFLMDYNALMDFSPRKEPRGVGVHPHRGFETVTIAYHGRIAHRDSAGNSGIIREGDVQWMTAASGLLHTEYHEESFSQSGGPFQMVQLWVNLPARFKMTPPKYQEIAQSKMGRHILQDGTGEVEVIAGEYQGTRGAASTFTPMHVYNLRLKKGARINLSFPANYNTGLLQVAGKFRIQETELPTDHFALMRNDGESFEVEALEDGIALLLSGEPIQESIAQYGPFLMNTWQELEKAIEDVAQGKFGTM
jgi:redox-sensitive bicupin YhaK (pirin superfamily)